jgi:mitochondrial fission protein ELM1
MADDDAVAEEGVQAGRPLPRTWLLMGHKAGDNAQLLALAEALGFPFETRRLAYRRTELVTNLLAGPNLLGVVAERSDRLEPPWPELVLTAGRRNEPVARWIREQAGGSGPAVKLVHVGRPWAPLPEFDLIVTTPQYSLPAEAPNVLHNEAPLHRVTAGRLAAAREAWAPRLAHLPRPYVTVVLGGPSGPYAFDREAGALLGHHAAGMARELGGSLLVTTSARTPVEAVDALEARLDGVPHELFRWGKGAAENPYFGFLALADRVVVTGDSMSMLVEAIATGRPVLVFDLARGRARGGRSGRPTGACGRGPGPSGCGASGCSRSGTGSASASARASCVGTWAHPQGADRAGPGGVARRPGT